jgi:hypothetical protein
MMGTSLVARILLTVLAIGAGAVLAGSYASMRFHGADEVRLSREAPEPPDHTPFILGAVAGGGMGALWSLQMNLLPKSADPGHILLRGIGVGGVAGLAAMEVVHLGMGIAYQRWEDPVLSLLIVPLFLGAPAGLLTGLICSLIPWYDAFLEGRWSPSPYTWNEGNKYVPLGSSVPAPAKALVALLGVLAVAFFFGQMMGVFMPNCTMRVLAGLAAGLFAGLPFSALWLYVIGRQPADAGCARTVVKGAILGAAVGGLAGLFIVFALAVVTLRLDFIAFGLVPALILGPPSGFVWGLVCGMLVHVYRSLRRTHPAGGRTR